MADQQIGISLSESEWRTVLGWIGNSVTWSQANPLMLKIGMQMQRQTDPQFMRAQGNSGREIHDVS